MSAPVTERTRQRARTTTRTATIPAQRTAARTAAPHENLGTSVQKAYARRDDRRGRMPGAGRVRAARRAAPAGRAQFVLLVMVLLSGGLVATLWLSTAAASDSYRLQDARAALQSLTAQSERLHRDVAAMSSAPALAQRAAQLGMVPVQDPARLVVDPSGAVTVVGLPKAAVAPAPVVLPVPAGAAAPAAGAPAGAAATGAGPGGGAPVAAQPGTTPPAAAAPPAAAPPVTQPTPAAGAAGTGAG
jgi:cell division protein FtsI (penicillin-binding protein 3)